MIGEFADANPSRGAPPSVVFVYQGTAEQGPMFFDGLDPHAVAIADPDAKLYATMQVERGGFRQMFGLSAWRAGWRALRKGHFINRKIGDAWTMPTVFALADQSVVWEFRGSHAGDHPDIGNLFERFTDRMTPT